MVGFVLGVNFVGGTDIPWTEALHASIRDQLPWALLTPLVFRFATRHLIDRGAWNWLPPILLSLFAAFLLFAGNRFRKAASQEF